MSDIIHFAHANSFPASIYGELFRPWHEQGWEVGYLDTIGHQPAYPVTDGWPHLVSETLDYMASRYRQPVVGVGHSLGGLILLFAAIREPARFRRLVILDSPLLSPRRAFGIWLAKRLGFIQQVTPGGNTTLKRRDNWASVPSVHDFFARKAMFAAWHPACLQAYAEHGTEENGAGGRRLKFRPQVEHDIYGTLPHHFWRLHGKLEVPLDYIAGAGSTVVGPHDIAYMQRHFAANVHQHAGSHLFPLEQPRETAAFILNLLARDRQ